jgi:acetyl coenzyme A synthetase (ADP forming)-like protein
MSSVPALAPLRPLDCIFNPRAVAVVGASRSRETIGWSIVHNLVAGEFAGAIYPVNPSAGSVHSLKCYPSLAAIPDPVDLALVVVPKPHVEGVIDEGLARGICGFVVITAGFGEIDAEGKALEQRLRDKVRAAGGRMIGPNCMGVINADPAVRMNATFSPTPARFGSLAFVSQSGALGVAILNVAEALGVGLSEFASMGNKADVSGNDLLERWEDDPATRVIAMYLESFGNPRRFAELAKRIARKKPILVVKAGRTAEGARAASSHTGALAGADVTVSSILEHCGVLRADTMEDLFDTARALSRQPLPVGRRVGIVTNAGGPGIMATDACVSSGLAIAEFGGETVARLRAFLPATASLANPVDMIASAGVEEYGRTVTAVLDDPDVDAVVVVNVTPLRQNTREIFDEITRVTRDSAKPVLAVMMATEDFYEGLKEDHEAPPVYRFPEQAARALAQMVRYAEWRRRQSDEEPPRFRFDEARLAELVARGGADGYLDPADALALLEAIGVPVVGFRRAADRAGALAAARELGYPVVIKALAEGLVHKSDLGAVALDLRDEDEAGEALAAMETRLVAADLAPAGFLVQRLARGGHEVIFGLSNDERFGPVLMFGLGGKYVEVLHDVRFGVPPLGRAEALELVRGIRGIRLLEGVRGERPADLDLLAEVLGRLAALAGRFPQIVELDVNPFLAGESGSSVALDARVRVRRS